MNTKTMRLPPRRVLTSNSNNKRKDRESFDPLKPSLPTPVSTKLSKPAKQLEPPAYNNLLAGYLAHEFLTKGTLFGQTWDPAKAELANNIGLVESDKSFNKKLKLSHKGKEAEADPNYQRYVEVSNLFKGGEGGPHLPGILNPSQLAMFLQM